MKFTLLTIVTACLNLPRSIHGISDEGLVQLFDFWSELSYYSSGDNVYDLSGNNNNGTIIGGDSALSFDATLGSNGALVFTGAGSFGYVNASLEKSANITFTCWAKVNNQGAQMMFNAGNNNKKVGYFGPNKDIGPNFFLQNGQYEAWNTWDGSSNSFTGSPLELSDNDFHQYVIVQESGGNATLYYDGVKKGTAKYRNVVANNVLAVGGAGGDKDSDDQRYPMNGAIERWSVHNRALSADDVFQDFLSGTNDQYLAMAENTNWCKAGYNRMTKEECKAWAAYRGLTYGFTNNLDYAPKGCYFGGEGVVTNSVNFNEHEKGSTSGERRPVCKALQLRERFKLPSPNCTTSESAIGIVTCAFTGINCPGNAIQSMSIFGYDCKTKYNSAIFGNTSVMENSTNTTCDSSVREFNVIAKVDYTSGHEGDVNFCIRTDLTESGEIMHYRSERVNMTFTYDGAFSVTSFNTSEYDGINDDATIATKSFGVVAVICDNRGNTLAGSPALAIGDNLFVCIETADVGTRITAITEFSAEKTGTNTLEKIDINESMSNVVVTGIDSEKLIVVINFPARFFTNTNVIILKGDVEVEGTRNRRLSTSKALQEPTPDISSEDATFGLVIDIVADTSSATGHGMMVAALIGVPTLLLV